MKYFFCRDRLRRMLTSFVKILEKVQNNQNNVGTESQNSDEKISKLEMEKLSVERDLKNTVTEHHTIMRDIRPLLRSFAYVSFDLRISPCFAFH